MLGKVPGISYDAISRVPFIWSWPGRIAADEDCGELVESVDLFPTLMSLLADESVPPADGHDLTGYLEGTDSEPVREYALTETPWAQCVRTDDQKLTVYQDTDAGEQFQYEFYDLADDPWEMENSSDDAATADAVDRHRGLLNEFLTVKRRVWTCGGEDTSVGVSAGVVQYRDRRPSPDGCE